MREDLYGGLRNALEHGASLDQAIKSFMNAGYPEAEVREAAQALDNRVIGLITQKSSMTPQQLPKQRTQAMPVMRAQVTRPPRQRPSLLIIVLSIILLLSIVTFVVSIIFRQQIAQMLSSFLA